MSQLRRIPRRNCHSRVRSSSRHKHTLNFSWASIGVKTIYAELAARDFTTLAHLDRISGFNEISHTSIERIYALTKARNIPIK
jgi:hypothetical protein